MPLVPVDYDPFQFTPVDHDPFVMPPANPAAPSPAVSRAVQSIASGVGNALMAPGRALQSTTPVTTEEMIQPAADLAGFAMTGGLPMAEKGALGIFGGRMAATADRARLAQAEQLAASGAADQEIWNKTGWFRGEDGGWRFEIPDTGFSAKSRATGATIGGAFDHPELFAAYPDLAAVKVGAERGSNAFYRPKIGPIPEKIGIGNKLSDVRAPVLHELQHAVQEREGFSGGSNPLRKLGFNFPTQNNLLRAEGEYYAHPGEVEARTVASRFEDLEQRAQPPADNLRDTRRFAEEIAALFRGGAP